jgi:hypothetical protein
MLAALSNACYASSPWVPEKNQVYISYNYSVATSFDKDIMHEYAKYRSQQYRIAHYNSILEGIKLDKKVTSEYKEAQIKYIEDRIGKAKNKISKIKKSISKDSHYTSYEQGLGNNFSVSINAAPYRNRDFDGRGYYGAAFEIAGKKLLYNKKSKAFAGTFGARLNDDAKSRFYVGISSSFKGKIKLLKLKFTTETYVEYFLSKKESYRTGASETINFWDWFDIKISSFASRNDNLYESDKYYFKDDLTIAKSFSGGIFNFAETTTLNIGVFQEYFARSRKKSARGISCGVWFKL